MILKLSVPAVFLASLLLVADIAGPPLQDSQIDNSCPKGFQPCGPGCCPA